VELNQISLKHEIRDKFSVVELSSFSPTSSCACDEKLDEGDWHYSRILTESSPLLWHSTAFGEGKKVHKESLCLILIHRKKLRQQQAILLRPK